MIGGRAIAFVALMAVAGSMALAQGRGSGSGAAKGQPYAGEQQREVSTLSAGDIAELKAGRGWGLARPAELNGYPGPAHVIELARELLLTDEQKAKVQVVFDWMKAQAEQAGKAYVDAEAALDASFRSGQATPDEIKARLAAAEKLRAELRRIHLEAHLETKPLLTEPQIKRYAELRGYGRAGKGSGSGSGSGRKAAPGKGSGAGSGSGSVAGRGSGSATAMSGGGCCCGGGGCGAGSGMGAGGGCGGGDGSGMSCRPGRP